MTNTEFIDLHESMCYGHDAEIIIDGIHFFLEWNKGKIEIFKVFNSVGTKNSEVMGSNRIEVVDNLFNTQILGKTLNNNFPSIELYDIE